MNNQIIQRLGNILAFVVILIVGLESHAWTRPSPILTSHLRIPILGTSINQYHRPVGLVSQIVVDLYERRDYNGLQVQFHTEPGQFSLLARKAIHQAITRAFHVANLPSSSLTVLLRFPYRGLTVYGESLSAMVGLSVVAMVKGDVLLEGRILTGTITDEGHIGSVRGLQLKILAAYRQHYQRVFIPGDYDIRDGDWQTPFLMQVSPVSTVEEAYLGLTGYQLSARP
ncbi:MAG: S16 family serine protease [Nitrospirota bacterium]|nr:S16 family serine protease [Nitrospirota bacterium]